MNTPSFEFSRDGTPVTIGDSFEVRLGLQLHALGYRSWEQFYDAAEEIAVSVVPSGTDRAHVITKRSTLRTMRTQKSGPSPYVRAVIEGMGVDVEHCLGFDPKTAQGRRSLPGTLMPWQPLYMFFNLVDLAQDLPASSSGPRFVFDAQETLRALRLRKALRAGTQQHRAAYDWWSPMSMEFNYMLLNRLLADITTIRYFVERPIDFTRNLAIVFALWAGRFGMLEIDALIDEATGRVDIPQILEIVAPFWSTLRTTVEKVEPNTDHAWLAILGIGGMLLETRLHQSAA